MTALVTRNFYVLGDGFMLADRLWYHTYKSHTMSTPKRVRLEAPASDINGGYEYGLQSTCCQNGVEDDNKSSGGLSKNEIMRLRAEHIG